MKKLIKKYSIIITIRIYYFSFNKKLVYTNSCSFYWSYFYGSKYMSEMEKHRNLSLDSREYRNVVI